MLFEPVKWGVRIMNYVNDRKSYMTFIDRLQNKYEIMLLLPEEANAIYEALVLRFEEHLLVKKMRGVTIAKQEITHSGNFIVIGKNGMNEIIKHYQLYDFTNKIIWGSLSRPSGRSWNNLINSGCMSKEQVIEAMLDF